MRFILLGLVLALAACESPAAPAPTKPDVAPIPDDHAMHTHGEGATAGYTCPMHPEVHADHPGQCPKCSMDLVAVKAGANRTYDVFVTTAPAPEAGKPTQLTLEVKDDTGARVKDLEVVHEKKLHLLMVSKDLAWFAHEHPVLQADGTMKLDFTFPSGGTYVVYADFRPSGASGQVVHKPVEVKGPPRAAVPLTVDDLAKAKAIAGNQVRMKASSLTAGENVRLDFLLVKDGKPVTDLTPYLGAMGHCVILSQDGSKFLHSHPDDGSAHSHAAGTAEHAHPPTPGQVSFQTQFPGPGRYKIWGQFQHGSEMIVADFVVDVVTGSMAGHGEQQH